MQAVTPRLRPVGAVTRLRRVVDRRPRRGERGYVAVVTALLLPVFMIISGFAVDVGHWYYVGQQEQRAADAAALAGVTSLPADQASAYADAMTYARANGFSTATGDTVTPTRPAPTRLKVEISRTVDNYFGPLIGLPTTDVSRRAVAEFSGPVPMGSPCNRFGDDPDPSMRSGSANCAAAGAFWANIGSPAAQKSYGDAYQNNVCSSESGCSGGTNNDYDPEGYTYIVEVKEAINNLTIEAFDPAQIVVGDRCEKNGLAAAAALPQSRTVVNDPSARYQPNISAWCTGDQNFGTGLVKTRFVVRQEGTDPWSPGTWPAIGGCSRTFDPFNGPLGPALDKSSASFKPAVADTFRRWVDLCTVNGLVQPGRYAVQVYTNGLGADGQSGHNRFALRAYGSNPGSADKVSLAGAGKMGMYGNTPSGTSRFYLAKVPTGSGGHSLGINLFDIGDGAVAGSTIRVLPPAEYGGSFSGCTGSGVANGSLPTCQIGVNSSFNGKWQTISVPIPSGYSCDDTSPTGCWVRLEFYYGAGSQPLDTTSWTASLEGDPIRLVE